MKKKFANGASSMPGGTVFFPKHDYEQKNGPSLPQRSHFGKRLLFGKEGPFLCS